MPRSVRLLLPLLLLLSSSLTAQEWVSIGPSGGPVTTMAADATTGDLYLAGRHPDLYRMSREIGVWEPIPHPNGTASTVVSLHARDGELLAALASNLLFHSDDGGSTWRPVTIPTVTAGARLGEVVTLRDTLYLFIDSKARLFRSVTNGRTWGPVEPVDWPAGIDLIYSRDSTGASVNFFVDADLGSLMWAMFQGDTVVVLNRENDLYRSYDRGATWTLYPVKGEYGMALHRDTLWAGMRDGTKVMPIDGDAWTERGALGHDVSGGRFTFAGDRVLAWNLSGANEWEGASGTFRTLDEGRNDHPAQQLLTAGDTIVMSTVAKLFVSGDGATWEPRSTPFNMSVGHLAWSQGRLYAIAGIGLGDSVYLSNDLGLSWRNISAGTDFDLTDGNVLYASGGALIVGGTPGILRTTNDGAEWERWEITRPVDVKALTGSGDTLFIRTASADEQIYRSLDLGATWHTDDTLTIGRAHEPIAFDNGVLYAGDNDRSLQRSTDLGATWERTVRLVPGAEPLDTTRFRITYLRAYGDTVVAIGSYGLGQTATPLKIFVSANRGGKWIELPPPAGVYPFGLLPWRDRLLLGTVNRSLFATAVTLGAEEERMRRGADGSDLRLAHDPARDLIRWSTPAPTSYAIELYTIAGEHVMTVASGEAEAGAHVVALPELAPGVYLCTVRTDAGDAGILIRIE